MRTIKLTDDHPGKWNDGAEVFLCNATLVNEERHNTFVTGFRKDGADLPQLGMFDKDSEPIQVIDNDTLTMYNYGTITREEINTLIRDGKITIGEEPFTVIDIEVM